MRELGHPAGLDGEIQKLRRRVAESPRDVAARERLAAALERSGEPLEAFLIRRRARVRGTVAALRSDQHALVCGASRLARYDIARAIHDASDRRNGRFIDFGAEMPAHLAENSIFGCYRGGFTGVRVPRPGAFEERDATVFISDLLHLREIQGKLAAAVTSGRARRLGELQDRPVEARLLVGLPATVAHLVRRGRLERAVADALPLRVEVARGAGA